MEGRLEAGVWRFVGQTIRFSGAFRDNGKVFAGTWHPEYYRRFGFQSTRGLVVEGVPEEVFFALSWDGRFPQGAVEFHEGFKADGS